MKVFDYIYVRIYNYFIKKGIITPDERATILVSLLQILIILNILLLFKLTAPNISKVILGAILLLIFWLNLRKFKNINPTYLARINAEDINTKKRNGFLLVGAFIFILGIFLFQAAQISFFD